MNKKKIFSILLASLLVGQTTFLSVSPTTVSAEEPTMVGTEQLKNNGTQAPAKDSVVPDENQYKYQKDELAAFCHFGPNTFNEIEWGEHYDGKAPGEIFKLEENFDADTFVKSIKEAGFKKLIVTAKHHDGFCIWRSKETEYDVESTKYKGDILAELSASCTQYGIDMGLYLSPWDIHDDSYGYKKADGTPLVRVVNGKNEPIDNLTWEQVKQLDAKDYNEYYNKQLIEILSDKKYGRDGHFTEVWMDGAKGSGAGYQEYEFKKWFDTIQKYEGKAAGNKADCMLFGAEAYTTVRWIGNEKGFANEETWSKSKVDEVANTIDSNKKGEYTVGFEDGNKWTVPECDARITSGWFWGTTKNTPKSIADLGEMYFNSVGHNAPLLLNIPPNNKGKVDEPILKRLSEFGKNIRETFDENLAKGGKVLATNIRGNDLAFKGENILDKNDDTYWTTDDKVTTGSIVVDLGAQKTFDVVSIEEAIKFGQRIKEFKVEYRNGEQDQWKPFAQGTTIGAKRLCRNTAVKASQIKITVKTSKDVPMISEVGVFKATPDFESNIGAPKGMNIIDVNDKEFKFLNGWNDETGSQYLNGTNKWGNKGAKAEVKFTGSKIYLVGTLDKGHGKASVTVDGKKVEINTNAQGRSVGQVIFSSDDLQQKEHTLTIEATENGKALGIEGAYVINNNELGMIGIENSKYTMNEDSEMEMKLVRVGGTKGEAKVTVAPNPGTAIQDDFDTEGTTTVTFADGEKEKNVTVITRRNKNKTGEQYFTEELSTDNENLILGFNSKSKITIIDEEEHPTGIPTEKLPKTAYGEKTATSEEKVQQQQGIDKAFDEDETTFWHANWANGKLNQNPNGISVTMKLNEVQNLGKLTYLPRLDPVDSGTIGNYIIESAIVEDNKTPDTEVKWTKVCEGTFTKQGNSKTPQNAIFPTPVKANRIRITAKSMAGGEHPTATEFALHKVTEAKYYTIKAIAGEGGSIAPVTGTLEQDGTFRVQEGKLKTFKIVPNKNYEIADVKVDGVSVGAVSRYTTRGTGNVTIEATFKSKTQQLANYSAVDTALNKIPKDLSIYTDESVKAVKDAQAAVVRGYDITRQAEVDAMAKAIEDAVAKLQKKEEVKPNSCDKGALEKYYNECLGYYKAEHYTSESWKNYQNALSNAKVILDKQDATQDEVNKAIKQLEEAAKNLVKKGDKGNSGQSGELPTTADNSMLPLGLAGMISAVLAGFGVKSRKKSKQ